MKIWAPLLQMIHPFSVHSRYKHDVGYRLSRAGLAIAYGQQVEFQGPIVQSIVHSSDSKVVNVTYIAASGLDIRNPNGFEVQKVFFLLALELFYSIFSGMLSRNSLLE